MNDQINFKRPQEYLEKICPSCNIVFNVSKYLNAKYHKKFCSSSCSATFNNKGRIISDQQKKKLSLSALKRLREKGPWGAIGDIKPVESRDCLECKKQFLPPKKYRGRKTCSNKCYNEYKIKHMPKPKTLGGYRPGSGRSKHGYYKGIYCGSTYELCWVIYNLDHNNKFTRFPSFLEKNKLKYYPDFLLGDGKTIIEIKGYESVELVEKKNKLAESFGYRVIVLRKNELKYVFDYVKEKYKVTEFQKLYDNYKPAYTYMCKNCHKNVCREIKTGKNVFCSLKCSGTYNMNMRLKNARPAGIEPAYAFAFRNENPAC